MSAKWIRPSESLPLPNQPVAWLVFVKTPRGGFHSLRLGVYDGMFFDPSTDIDSSRAPESIDYWCPVALPASPDGKPIR